MSRLRVSVSNFLKCLLKPQMHVEMLGIKDTQRHNKASVCFRRYLESISAGSTRARWVASVELRHRRLLTRELKRRQVMTLVAISKEELTNPVTTSPSEVSCMVFN